LHDTIACREVHKEDMERIPDIHHALVKKFRSIRITYLTLDLEGYRNRCIDEVM